MTEPYKKPSGAMFRKQAKEREERKGQVLKKTPKLSSFFSNVNLDPCSSSRVPVSVLPSESDINLNMESLSSENQKIPTCMPQALPSLSIGPLSSNNQNNKNVVSTTAYQAKETEDVLSYDPALWLVNENLRNFIFSTGLQQNDGKDFSKSERKYNTQSRHLTKAMFLKPLANGEIINRNWLVYSESTGKVFCGPCKLFNGKTTFANQGFNDWKHFHMIAEHENSLEHRECVSKYCTRERIEGRVDTEIAKQYNEEVEYWRNVLRRVSETIKFLASRGLALYGRNETIGSPQNGNFLGCIELISKFDPFMAGHIARYGNKGTGIPSYLSSTIVDELIILQADCVRKAIITEVTNAKYYSISVDSTPDISHVDQLTFIIRYVLPSGYPVERFITFLPNSGHSGEDIENVVMVTILETLKLDINNCRGQSYDNASNMSGRYKGLQSRIKQRNPVAFYVPCAAHSLQLAGSAATESSDDSVKFFSLEQQLYTFFARSVSRWQILVNKFDKDSLTLKSLSKTRWSARSDASKALYNSYDKVIAALDDIKKDPLQKTETKMEAKFIYENVKTLEMTIMLCFWNRVLQQFHNVNVQLQAVDINLSVVVNLYKSLISALNVLREESEFQILETEAIHLCGTTEYSKDSKRQKSLKLNIEDHTNFTGKQSLRIEKYYVAIDSLIQNIEERLSVYTKLNSNFDFLWNLKEVNNTEIRHKANLLQQIYNADLDATFPTECVNLAQFLKENKFMNSLDTVEDKLFPQQLLQLIKSLNVGSIYTNIEIILRIYLTMAVTNCSGERSFSALKRVKNYLFFSYQQEKLQGLAILYIESDILCSLSFDEIIEKFAKAKSRKQSFI